MSTYLKPLADKLTVSLIAEMAEKMHSSPPDFDVETYRSLSDSFIKIGEQLLRLSQLHEQQ